MSESLKRNLKKLLPYVLIVLSAALFVFAFDRLMAIVERNRENEAIYESMKDMTKEASKETEAREASSEKTEEDSGETEAKEASSEKTEEASEETGSEASASSETEEKRETLPVTESHEAVFPEHEHEAELTFMHTKLSYLLVPEYEMDFDALCAMNPDIIGWIRIPGTNIDYPLVKSHDNAEYLRLAADGTPNNAGAVFMDMSSSEDFSDRNTIIHAHNQENHKMFHDLVLYEDESFFLEHPYVEIFLPDGQSALYRIFSCYVMENVYTYTSFFANDEDFEEYLSYTFESALYKTGQTVGKSDSVITLSTCTPSNSKTRFVVHAVKIQ